MSKLAINLRGQKFGRLTVIQQAPCDRFGGARWECRCDCGATKIANSARLRNGDTTSCGCYHREVITRHGGSYSVEYTAWQDMKARCTNPNDPYWEDYGGRGIRVCKEWQNDYSAFLAHIGPKPSPELSLDRIDNNGNYKPGNVRWATKKEQNDNRRQN
jgi:hypothetical protein